MNINLYGATMHKELSSCIYSLAAFYKEGFSKGDTYTQNQQLLFRGLSINDNNLNLFMSCICQLAMMCFLITIY